MKGLALEFVFKMFLYIVVIMVVVGLIVFFRDSIISALNLCQYLPSGCPQKEECSTVQATEAQITASILDKYCNLCWSKTGAKDYQKDCLCYIVKGSFSSFPYSNQNCELKCSNQATSLIFTYSSLFKKIIIEC
jgi:hypothetical protein